MNRFIIVLGLIFLAFVSTCRALPQRLYLALDGISYRDVQALQEGVTYTNVWGIVVHRQAFTAAEGYYPVSRMVSTFPSTSDVAWTDIFGNRPLPGYQRTFYSPAANSEVAYNGLTTTVEHERQMDWQAESNFARSMGYIYSVHVFEYELHNLMNTFWDKENTNANYYIYLRSSDDAQHMERDIFSMLSMLDKDLQKMRARYRAQTGRDLQIVLLSDHGHNHAGRGERVQVVAYLESAGYNITRTIDGTKDVVLPTAGIEDWIEIHNDPPETEKLAESLTHLKGVDVIAARLSEPTNNFLVLNSEGERALIQWNPTNNTFKYSAEKGDPLNYLPVVESLSREKKLDADGFATANDWMSATMTNHYPLALQRIVRGLTCVTLNPATILVSLDNRYVHAGWLVNGGSQLESCGSTHGALDEINSLGVLLTNFEPTHDLPTDEVAGFFGDFPGLRKYRTLENGAEFVTREEQARTRIKRDPFDWNYESLPDNGIYLRVWSPELAQPGTSIPLEAVIEKLSGSVDVQTGAVTLQPKVGHAKNVTFSKLLSFPRDCDYERIYACPADLGLEPKAEYRISGWARGKDKDVARFVFTFRTNEHGQPVAY
ncbi:MAG TPA: alkaline phosphatase family protein [Pseudomonadales bacterium]|nr:alkaline phosphatase family protein [Pseudomonadales bacterium]